MYQMVNFAKDPRWKRGDKSVRLSPDGLLERSLPAKNDNPIQQAYRANRFAGKLRSNEVQDAINCRNT